MPCKLSSLMNPRKIVDFQFAQLFLVRIGVSIFKLYPC